MSAPALDSPAPGGLSSALAYARRGWRVLPLAWVEDGRCCCERLWDRGACSATGKHPLWKTGRGHQDATTVEFFIRQWWRKYPGANVGIVTGLASGLLVLDVDRRGGGLESLARFEAEYGLLPATPTVVTPSGGLHLYFKHPDHGEIKGTVGWLPGIDVRAYGNFVVAPPSVGPKGEYRWR